MAAKLDVNDKIVSDTNPLPIKGVGTDGTIPVVVSGSNAEVASSEITVSTTAQTITRSDGEAAIELYVLAGSVNVRADGSAATATTGRPLGAGMFMTLNAASVSLIRAGSTDATVRLVNGAVEA